MYMLTYVTTDGSGEVDTEFNSLKEAQAVVDSMCGLLHWHSITDQYGNEPNFGLAKNVYARHTSLAVIIGLSWADSFTRNQTLREASNAGYARCIAEPAIDAHWSRIDAAFIAYARSFDPVEVMPLTFDFSEPVQTDGPCDVCKVDTVYAPVGGANLCYDCATEDAETEEELCIDEGCPHYGKPHVCITIK